MAYGENGKNFSGNQVVDLDAPIEDIPEKKEIIFLSNRYSRGNYLEQSCPDSPWYELNYNGNYISVSRHGNDILTIDQEGGPYITPGCIIAGFHVLEIRECSVDGKYLLNLKKNKLKEY